MISAPNSRLPKALSATTLAVVVALLLTLLFQALGILPRGHREPSTLELALLGARPTGDTIAGWHTREATPARVVFEAQLDALDGALDTLGSSLDRGTPLATRRAFRRARLAYKRAESLLQLYSPTIAHSLNGPLENDDGDAPPRPLGSPAGFQTILSSLGDTAQRASSRALAYSMRDEVRHLRGQTRYLDVASLPVLESARTELARVTTLGLAGVDLDDTHDAVREAAASLDGMGAVVEAEAASSGARSDTSHASGVSRDAWHHIARTLRDASAYLRAHPDFERLDRLTLIADYAQPAARAVADARAPLLAHSYALRRVWRADAPTVFDLHALDATAFAPDYAPAPSPALIALGAQLFNDTRLSGAEDRSCATCHQPGRAFTDGRARPMLISGAHMSPAKLARNTPTLLEVAYQPLYFADERALSLEDQIGTVLASPTEMGSSADLAAAHLARDTTVRAEVAHALAKRSDSALTGRAVRIALAAYLRSLGTFDSRFDRAARGDSSALTPEERRGFTLFMGKSRCGTCHFAPLFSGVMPPEFTSSEPEIIGVATRATLSHARLDPDSGRAGVDHIPEHRFAFKVPTLRNIARTAPYMHNGAYATLDQVMDFYEHGGGAGLGARVPNATLPSSRLHLTSAERRAVIAFLRTLTDAAPVTAPSLAQLQPKVTLAR
ncbi:MAG TPA: cytochrome c peroxidase [Gemmatimonadaceae bacterium]|nr:cytochrome c peroxidase [Gemmatimonadaceae bacterium]